jgi:hypothetical protein
MIHAEREIDGIRNPRLNHFLSLKPWRKKDIEVVILTAVSLLHCHVANLDRSYLLSFIKRFPQSLCSDSASPMVSSFCKF